MNQNALGYGFAFEYLYGAWDIPSTEYNGISNGYDSTLHMYCLSEALGQSRLYGIFNSSNQVKLGFRYKVCAAEAECRIICIGSASKRFVEKLGLPEDVDIVFINSFLNVVNESKLDAGDAFRAALQDTGAARLLSLGNLDNAEATIRQSDENHTVIHVIHRGEEKGDSIWSQTVSYLVPDGKQVSDVTVECPYAKDYRVYASWQVKDGILEIVISDYDTYAVIGVTLQ